MPGDRDYLCNGCGQIIILGQLDDLRCPYCGSGEVETVDADPLPGGPEAYAVISPPPEPSRGAGKADVAGDNRAGRAGDGFVWSQ